MPYSFLDGLTQLMLPRHCLVCGRTLRVKSLCAQCLPLSISSKGRCDNCFTLTIRLNANGRCETCYYFALPFGRVRYLWDYQGKAQTLINTMKYRPSPKLAAISARIIQEQLATLYPASTWDMFIPIPSSRQSIHERGFNQCITIAQILAQTFKSRSFLELDILQHKGYRCAQASLSYAKRASNVARAFHCQNPKIQNKTILLIEDVITSGATTWAATRALLNSGAQSIDVLALARSPSWQEHRYATWAYFSRDRHARAHAL